MQEAGGGGGEAGDDGHRDGKTLKTVRREAQTDLAVERRPLRCGGAPVKRQRCEITRKRIPGSSRGSARHLCRFAGQRRAGAGPSSVGSGAAMGARSRAAAPLSLDRGLFRARDLLFFAADGSRLYGRPWAAPCPALGGLRDAPPPASMVGMIAMAAISRALRPASSAPATSPRPCWRGPSPWPAGADRIRRASPSGEADDQSRLWTVSPRNGPGAFA